MKAKESSALAVRISSKDREELQAEADERGMKLSTYLRFLWRTHPGRAGAATKKLGSQKP